MLLSSLLKAEVEGALSYFAGSVIAALFALVTFIFALRQKDGWSGGIPFIPDAWNQIIARLVIAFGGLLLMVTSVAFFRMAMRKRRRG